MEASEKILYSKVRLLMRHKFFGALLLYFPLVERKNIAAAVSTMATDGKKIYWDPTFVDKLDKDETMGVVLHEIMHNFYKHFYRFRSEFKPGKPADPLLNLALDYAINSIILNDMKRKDNLIKLPKGVLYDEKFKGMNAEKILALLKKEQKENPQQSQIRVKEAQGSGDGSGQFDNHDVSGNETGDQIVKETKKSGKSADEQAQDIDKKAYKIYEGLSAKEKGDVPGELKRLIDEYFENLKGHINWKKYIRNKLQDIGRSQYTSIRFNKKYLQGGFYLPGMTGARGKVAMALDTSGSISEEELKDFIGEIAKALTQFPSLEVVTYGVDARIQGKANIKGKRQFRPKTLDKVLKGGGGTAFTPVWQDLLATRDKDIKMLFYFTDGYGDQNQIESNVGTKGAWRTFWVVPKGSKDVDFPFGEKIVMRD